MTHRSIEDLIKQLSDKDGLTRERARHTLVLIGKPALDALHELTDSPDKQTRWEAAKTLSTLGEPSSSPVFIRLLRDPEADIRWLAAEGLIRVGPRTIAPLLHELVEDPDSMELRRGAHHVFHDLGQDNRVIHEILAPILSVLGDVDPIGALPPRAEEALEHLKTIQGIEDSWE